MNRLAALGTDLRRPKLDRAHLGMAGLIEDPAAAAAFKESLSSLDGNHRNEEKTDIVIKALESG